jgi:2-polyprenyl-6-methoxyphenol hydroxylase-like FAD-dependent oxidoreductase
LGSVLCLSSVWIFFRPQQISTMAHHHKLRVLVVGASIAGPTAAYWLARAGAQVTVIERFPELRTGGQNVDIRTVGVTVMRKMPGMEAAVRAKVVPMAGIRFVDTHGRAIATLEATGNPDEQSLVSEYEIMRGDLSQILVDMTKTNKNITYIFGAQVVSIEPSNTTTDSDADRGPVKVAFANNTLPPTEFDLIVACDGASSRTRALGFNCSVREHMQPLNWWASWFTLRGDRDPSLPLAQLQPGTAGPVLGHAYSAPGGRLVMAMGGNPPGVTRVGVMGVRQSDEEMAAFRAAAEQARSSKPSTTTTPTTTTPTTENDTALKCHIASRFASAGWLSPALAAGLLSPSACGAADFYATEVVCVKPPTLYNLRRRVVLVGDAGYAAGPTGTGTSLALAGAYVLAGEVAKQQLRKTQEHDDAGWRKEGGGDDDLILDLRAALEGYERVMRPVVDELQGVSALVGMALAPRTWWGLRVRNALLWFVCWLGLPRLLQGRFAAAFQRREEDRLPEYEWVE